MKRSVTHFPFPRGADVWKIEEVAEVHVPSLLAVSFVVVLSDQQRVPLENENVFRRYLFVQLRGQKIAIVRVPCLIGGQVGDEMEVFSVTRFRKRFQYHLTFMILLLSCDPNNPPERRQSLHHRVQDKGSGEGELWTDSQRHTVDGVGVSVKVTLEKEVRKVVLGAGIGEGHGDEEGNEERK